MKDFEIKVHNILKIKTEYKLRVSILILIPVFILNIRVVNRVEMFLASFYSLSFRSDQIMSITDLVSNKFLITKQVKFLEEVIIVVHNT